MLIAATIILMLVVAYVFWREGLLTAVTMCLNVFLAGLVAFNFYEPLADLLEANVTVVEGYEDSLCLVVLFATTLGLLRWATNSLANTDLEFPAALLRGGGVFFGLVTGYLVSGFLACVLQTLPWHENFMGFDYRFDSNSSSSDSALRHILPPDRVWLGLMRRAGVYAFSTNEEDPDFQDPDTLEERYTTFDKYGTFELRYARYRRYDDAGVYPRPYLGECDKELGK